MFEFLTPTGIAPALERRCVIISEKNGTIGSGRGVRYDFVRNRDAPCAASCALIGMTPASSGAPIQASSDEVDQACCPHHRQTPSRTVPGSPCSQVKSQPTSASMVANRLSNPTLSAVAALETLPIRMTSLTSPSIRPQPSGDPPGADPGGIRNRPKNLAFPFAILWSVRGRCPAL